MRFSLREYGFEDFDKETKNNITQRGGIIIENREDLKEHIKISLSEQGKDNKVRLYMGGIDKPTREKINNETGDTVFKKDRQYAFSVSYDDIKHVAKHYKSIDEQADMILKLYAMLSSYDNISAYYENNGKQIRLKLEKNFPDANYLGINIVGNTSRTVDMVTLYITKINKKTGGQAVPPATLSVASRGGSSTLGGIIAKDSDFVKPKAQQNLKNAAQNVQSQPRLDEETATSPRMALSDALVSLAQNEAEKQMLKQYQAQLNKLNDMEAEVRRIGEGMKQLEHIKWQYGTREQRDEYFRLKNNKATLENKISRADAKLLNLEQVKPLKDLYKRVQEQKVQQAKDRAQAALERYKGRREASAERSQHLERIDKRVKELSRWIYAPDTKNHVPAVLQGAIVDFLSSLDVAHVDSQGYRSESKRVKSWQEAVRALRERLEAADSLTLMREEAKGTVGKQEKEVINFVMDIDPDLFNDMSALTESNNDVVRYRDMGAESLKDLDGIIERIRYAVQNANKLHTASRFQSVQEMSEATIRELKSRKEKTQKQGFVDALDTALNVDMLDSFSWAERVGDGGQQVIDRQKKYPRDAKRPPFAGDIPYSHNKGGRFHTMYG